MIELSTLFWLAGFHFPVMGFFYFSMLAKFRRHGYDSDQEVLNLIKSSVEHQTDPAMFNEELVDRCIEEQVLLRRSQRNDWEGISVKYNSLFYFIWIMSFVVFILILSD